MFKHAAHLVFTGALVLSIASLLMLASADRDLLSAVLLLAGLSVVVNVASIVRSEGRGFGRQREMRRAHEPQRHLSALQIGLLVALTMGQVGLSLFFVLQP